MSIVINTNIASLSAQRALAKSSDEVGLAMERLASGSKLNSSADDAAGMAVSKRMSAEVAGLNMAVRNAGDGMALTQAIEGSLDQVSDMLQRIRELAIQAANATYSAKDRSYIQEEVNQLVSEINRISQTSNYNGEKVLDGSFTNKAIKLGMYQSEEIVLSVRSIAIDDTGVNTVYGNGPSAQLAATTAPANELTVAEDFTVSGRLGTVTINALASDSARDTAARINQFSNQTDVTAAAHTYAKLASLDGTAGTYSLNINGTSTGNFSISSTSTADAVRAINAVSGASGVTASSTSNDEILLFNGDGEDITIENLSTGSDLTVQKLDFLGATEIGSAVRMMSSGGNDAVIISGSIRADSVETFDITQANDGDNTAAIKITDAAFTTLTDATYNIMVNGVATEITPAAATVEGFQAAIDATNLAGDITVADFGGQLQLTGSETLGDFTLQDANGLAIFMSAADSTDGEVKSTDIATVATTDDTLSSLTAGSYIIQSNGVDYAITPAAATVESFQTAIDATALKGLVTASAVGTSAATDTAAVKETAEDLANLNAGAYNIMVDGVATAIAPGAATVEGFQAAIDATDLNGSITAADVGGKLQLTGVDTLGDIVLQDADGLAIAITADNSTDGAVSGADIVGVSTTTDALADLTDASYVINAGGEEYTITPAEPTAAAFQAAIDATDLTGLLTASAVGGADVEQLRLVGSAGLGDFTFATAAGVEVALDADNTITGARGEQLRLTGAASLGGFTLQSAAGVALDLDANNSVLGARKVSYFQDESSSLNTVSSLNISTIAGATAAIATADAALNHVAQTRADLGAIENRLEYSILNLMNVAEKTESARSRIADADFALESARLAKAQVLQQAGTSMLSQANQLNQLALELLRS